MTLVTFGGSAVHRAFRRLTGWSLRILLTQVAYCVALGLTLSIASSPDMKFKSS